MALHQLDPDGSRPMLEHMTVRHYQCTNLPLAVRTDFLTCILLYSLVNCVQWCYLMPRGSVRRSERLHLKFQSCGSQCTSLPSFREVLGTKLGWECSQGRKQQTTNTPLFPQELAHCSKTVPNTVNRNMWLSDHSECEPFCKTRARTLPKEIRCLS